MTIKETIAQLEEHLLIRLGNAVMISTWENNPILIVKYKDDKAVVFDLESRDDFNTGTLPADQIISLCYSHQSIISTERNRRNELLHWLEEYADEELEVTNSELLDHVWMRRNLTYTSRRVHEELERLNNMRSTFLAYEEVIRG